MEHKHYSITDKGWDSSELTRADVLNPVEGISDQQSAPTDNDDTIGTITTTPPPYAYSQDFRSVHWFGTTYGFTSMQARIVEQLWKSWEQGTPEVGDESLLETVDSTSSRLVDIFRNSPAWNTLIVRGSTKGSRRLAARPQS